MIFKGTVTYTVGNKKLAFIPVAFPQNKKFYCNIREAICGYLGVLSWFILFFAGISQLLDCLF
jgi:hypothetical protein